MQHAVRLHKDDHVSVGARRAVPCQLDRHSPAQIDSRIPVEGDIRVPEPDIFERGCQIGRTRDELFYIARRVLGDLRPLRRRDNPHGVGRKRHRACDVLGAEIGCHQIECSVFAQPLCLSRYDLAALRSHTGIDHERGPGPDHDRHIGNARPALIGNLPHVRRNGFHDVFLDDERRRGSRPVLGIRETERQATRQNKNADQPDWIHGLKQFIRIGGPARRK